jgi:hypothetical protein
MKALYIRLCMKRGPLWRGQHLTISAWAWIHSLETGDKWLRNRIDGAFLFFKGEANHCQSRFQRETAKYGD